MFKKANILLSHLPEIYQTSGGDIQQLLSVFEYVLLGGDDLSMEDDDRWLGLEQKIAAIPNLFDTKPNHASANPFARTPQHFLPWLAEWVALGQLQLLTEEQCRTLIANIVPLYSSRGTKSYLSEILKLFFPGIYAIIHDKELPALTLGQSKIGLDSRLGGDIPFYFYIKLQFPTEEEFSKVEQIKENACLVIDLAKPAHTAYQLEIEFGINSKSNIPSPEEKDEYLP